MGTISAISQRLAPRDCIAALIRRLETITETNPELHLADDIAMAKASIAGPRNTVAVRITRHDVDELRQHLAWAHTVEPVDSERGEPVALTNVRRFKYWVGRNLNNAHRLKEQTDELIEQAGYPEPQRKGENREDYEARIAGWKATVAEPWQKLVSAVHAKQQELADRNEQGQVIMAGERPKLSETAQTTFMEWEKAERQKYPDVIAWMEERQALQSAILDQEVEFTVHTWPFERVPLGVSGGIMDGLSVMLDGIPDAPADRETGN